jgi:hypothetical protein
LRPTPHKSRCLRIFLLISETSIKENNYFHIPQILKAQ